MAPTSGTNGNDGTGATAGIGVDGCRGGWLAIRIGDGGWEARVFPAVADLHAAWCGPGSLTLVDIPIGLPDDTSCRPCDAAARRYLGSRASSVFNPPTRAALAATSYTEAADLNEQACGKRISRQTWFIMPKIAEVDRLLRRDPTLQARMREAHPETLFQALNGDEPLRHRKKVAGGRRERLAVLARHLPEAEAVFEAIWTGTGRDAVAPDDILDALVVATVAYRFSGALHTLPDRPERDAAGLVCEMVLPSTRLG